MQRKSDSDTEINEIVLPTGTEYKAHFSSKSGFLLKYESIAESISAKINLIKYGTTAAREKSGAYLFLPDGPAKYVEESFNQWIRVEQGELRSRVCVDMLLALHCVEIFPTINQAKGFKIPFANVWNVVDIRKTHNYELAMLVHTNVKNEDVIYTDLNGFQYTKRKRYDKLTIQGNVFPMPTGAFIQDSNLRFNIMTAQPLGVASLANSQMQVFLDRRLDQDDNLGMEQAMNDNVVASNRLILFFDTINSVTSSNDKIESVASNFPSLMSTWLSSDLLYPTVKLLLDKESRNAGPIAFNRTFTTRKYPCDLHLVNLRTMQGDNEEPMANQVGLILRRVVFEDCLGAPFVQLPGYVHANCDNEIYTRFKFLDFFTFLDESVEKMQVESTLLTLAKNTTLSRLKKTDYVLNFVQPMQIEAFKILF